MWTSPFFSMLTRVCGALKPVGWHAQSTGLIHNNFSIGHFLVDNCPVVQKLSPVLSTDPQKNRPFGLKKNGVHDWTPLRGRTNKGPQHGLTSLRGRRQSAIEMGSASIALPGRLHPPASPRRSVARPLCNLRLHPFGSWSLRAVCHVALPCGCTAPAARRTTRLAFDHANTAARPLVSRQHVPRPQCLATQVCRPMRFPFEWPRAQTVLSCAHIAEGAQVFCCSPISLYINSSSSRAPLFLWTSRFFLMLARVWGPSKPVGRHAQSTGLTHNNFSIGHLLVDNCPVVQKLSPVLSTDPKKIDPSG